MVTGEYNEEIEYNGVKQYIDDQVTVIVNEKAKIVSTSDLDVKNKKVSEIQELRNAMEIQDQEFTCIEFYTKFVLDDDLFTKEMIKNLTTNSTSLSLKYINKCIYTIYNIEAILRNNIELKGWSMVIMFYAYKKIPFMFDEQKLKSEVLILKGSTNVFLDEYSYIFIEKTQKQCEIKKVKNNNNNTSSDSSSDSDFDDTGYTTLYY